MKVLFRNIYLNGFFVITMVLSVFFGLLMNVKSVSLETNVNNNAVAVDTTKIIPQLPTADNTHTNQKKASSSDSSALKDTSHQQINNFATPTDSVTELSSNYNRSGVVEYNNRDFRGAIEYYTKAIETNPTLGLSYDNRGNAKLSLKDYQGAITDFNKAIELTPKYEVYYIDRGVAKSFFGDNQGAITDFNVAIKIYPNSGRAYKNRGTSKYLLEDYKGAIDDYSKALEFFPNDATLIYYRGNARSKAGDKEGSCLDWKKSLDLGYKAVADTIKKYCN
jgi:tetratricopeptide (TPR) repeat protein